MILPLQKYKEQVQITLDRVDFYSNRLTNHFPVDPSDEDRQLVSQIRSDLRSAATQLSSKYIAISFRKPLILFKVIPSDENIDVAHKALIYLHNSILYEDRVDDHNNVSVNNEKIKELRTALMHF